MSHSAGVYPAEDTTELQTLLRKLSDIGDEIERNRHNLERNRHNLEQLAREFSAVSSVIRAASPLAGSGLSHGADVPRERSVPNLVLQVLAGTRQALGAREIAVGIMTLQALDFTDADRLKHMTHRVCVSLWVQNQKGLVRKIEASRSRFRWELVRE